MHITETFWTNPQYRVSVQDSDADNDEGYGTIILGVMQKNRRNRGKENLPIGYYIFPVSKVNFFSSTDSSLM